METHINICLTGTETLEDALSVLLGSRAPATTGQRAKEMAAPREKPDEKTVPQEVAEEEKPAPDVKKAPKSKKAAKPTKATDAESTIERIRKPASDAINRGKREEVEEILAEYGGIKSVSDDEADEVIERIKGL